jgi:hypothetical protein
MQQSRMLFTRPSLLSLLVFAIYSASLISCSDDPEPDEETDKLSCLPATAARIDGKFFDYYYYGENDNLTKIELRSGTSISTRYTVQYEGDKVKYVLVDYVAKNEMGAKYELVYDGNGKPTEAIIYTVQTDSEPSSRIEFTHDDAGRIATKKYFVDGVWTYAVRYEYANGNVQKMFITKSDVAEYLASEFTSYDDKKRFFSTSEELTLLELYLFDYEPSANNALTQVMHADLSSVYTPAKQINFTVTYDENNYVKSLQNETNFATNTILFSSMTYQCK